MDLKNEWKETGSELLGALTSLGKTLVRSAQVGIRKVDEWANGESAEKTSDDSHED